MTLPETIDASLKLTAKAMTSCTSTGVVTCLSRIMGSQAVIVGRKCRKIARTGTTVEPSPLVLQPDSGQRGLLERATTAQRRIEVGIPDVQEVGETTLRQFEGCSEDGIDR